MKDGTTHLAYKAEHAVDMESGAVIAVTLQAADQGDTTTIQETLAEAGETVARLIEREAGKAPEEKPQVNLNGIEELVADKGYHGGKTVLAVEQAEVRSYIPEPKRQLIHVGAFNLRLILRRTLGAGTPRELRNLQPGLIFALLWLNSALPMASARSQSVSEASRHQNERILRLIVPNRCRRIWGGCATGC